MIAHAVRDHRPLFAAPSPFLAMQKAPKNRRWSNTNGEERSLHAEIPVDIMLAGCPVEG